MQDTEEKIKELVEKIEEKEKKEREEKTREKEEEKRKMENIEKAMQKIEEEIRKMKEEERKDEKQKKKQEEKKEEKSHDKDMEERRWEEWNRKIRKKNIIITGTNVKEVIRKEMVEEWLKKELGIRLIKIWIIEGRRGLVGAECSSREEKERIMESKNRLKGTKTYIDHDLTFKERRNRKIVWKKAREYKDEGKNVRVGYNKIIVENEEHRFDEWREKLFRKREEDTKRGKKGIQQERQERNQHGI